MINQPLRRAALAALASLSLFTSASRGQTIVGTGTSSSFLVIEAGVFGAPLVFEYRYTETPGLDLDTHVLLTAVDAADPDLEFSFVNFGSDSPSYFLDSITYNGTTLTNTPFPDVGPFWFQSVSGGLAGFPTGEPIASGTWSDGSGLSIPFRTIQPGSWDGFVYGDFGDYPSIAPVPEVSSLILLWGGLAAVVFFIRRRKRNA